jgi:hypothetical protein
MWGAWLVNLTGVASSYTYTLLRYGHQASSKVGAFLAREGYTPASADGDTQLHRQFFVSQLSASK